MYDKRALGLPALPVTFPSFRMASMVSTLTLAMPHSSGSGFAPTPFRERVMMYVFRGAADAIVQDTIVRDTRRSRKRDRQGGRISFALANLRTLVVFACNQAQIPPSRPT